MVAVSDTEYRHEPGSRAKVFEPFSRPRRSGRAAGSLSQYPWPRQSVPRRVGHPEQKSATARRSRCSSRALPRPCWRAPRTLLETTTLTPVGGCDAPDRRRRYRRPQSSSRWLYAMSVMSCAKRKMPSGAPGDAQEPDIALLITDFATGDDRDRFVPADPAGAAGSRRDPGNRLPTCRPTTRFCPSMHILRKPFDLPDILRAVSRAWSAYRWPLPPDRPGFSARLPRG